MNKIIISQDNRIELKPIDENDIEKIRVWKNDHRNLFFFKDMITPEDQKKWYAGYLTRENDIIFIISYKGNKIGCIAFRNLEDYIDIYNVILGEKQYGKKGLMGDALKILCNYLADKYNKEISLKVLSENPAKFWYEKNGFEPIYEQDDFIFMKLDKNKLEKITYLLK